MERLRFPISCILALSACVRSDGAFQCSDDAQCGAGGQCEMSVHFCSFIDTACPSGRRYGKLSGPEATHCVPGISIPSTMPDASDMPDAPDAPDAPLEMPRFIKEEHNNDAITNSLDYVFDLPAGDRRFLLVTVQIGSRCDNITPVTSSVSFDSVPLVRIHGIFGTPFCANGTRSEQWGLVDPHVGTHRVRVLLNADALTVHSAALLFTGVNQVNPVRNFVAASGGVAGDLTPRVTVSSAPGDLVVNTVGHGAGIVQPLGCDQRFSHNVSTSNTLDNSAGCTAPGGTEVQIAWEINGSDEWQTISSSLQP